MTDCPILPNEIIMMILSLCHDSVLCSLKESMVWEDYHIEIMKIKLSPLRLYCDKLGYVCDCGQLCCYTCVKRCTYCRNRICNICSSKGILPGNYGYGSTVCLSCTDDMCVGCDKRLCITNLYEYPRAKLCPSCLTIWCDDCKVVECAKCGIDTVYSN
jgi:hypothetical protein